jgi:hypothetical protein
MDRGGLAVLIEGWSAIGAELEKRLLAGLQSESRRIVALDPDFVHWPLSSPAVLEALQDWGKLGHRRLELMASDWSDTALRHGRFLQWRRHFDHLLTVRRFDPAEVGEAEWPLTLLAVQGGPSLRVIEREHGRALCSDLPTERQRAFEQFDAIAQRSGPGWPLTTLGL